MKKSKPNYEKRLNSLISLPLLKNKLSMLADLSILLVQRPWTFFLLSNKCLWEKKIIRCYNKNLHKTPISTHTIHTTMITEHTDTEHLYSKETTEGDNHRETMWQWCTTSNEWHDNWQVLFFILWPVAKVWTVWQNRFFLAFL